MRRSCAVQSMLDNGDVMVWGGSARLVYHGVRPLRLGLRFDITLQCRAARYHASDHA